jgi:O-antigen ligase
MRFIDVPTRVPKSGPARSAGNNPSSHLLRHAFAAKSLREERKAQAMAAGSELTMEERPNRREGLVLLGLTGVLAYTTFQWGGVVRTGRYEYLLVLGLLAIMSSLGRSRGGWPPLPNRVVRWAVALLPGYVLLQVVPLPVALLRVLSPARAEGVDALGPIGARLSFASFSVFPAGTFQCFLLVCGYLLIFLLACQLTTVFAHRPWLVVWPLIGMAALEAGLGLWQYFGGTGEQFRWGTYANHDHYAGFLEMVLPFAVMYPVARLRRPRSRLHAPVAPALAACGGWALAGLIFAGVVYSLSRMGFIATLSSLFVMGALALGTRQLRWVAGSRMRQWVAVGMVAALVLAGFVFLPPDRLILRFAQLVSPDGLTADGRINLWSETIPLIRAYPVFGCGLGGYETAFWKFKVSGVLVTDDFAHNDYLQLMAELGLVGFLIGAALAFCIVRKTIRGAMDFSDPEARYFAVACAGALAAILLHSLVDFNLYIPANTMLLAWIAGMAAGNRLQASSVSEWERLGYRKVVTIEAAAAGSRQ